MEEGSRTEKGRRRGRRRTLHSEHEAEQSQQQQGERAEGLGRHHAATWERNREPFSCCLPLQTTIASFTKQLLRRRQRIVKKKKKKNHIQDKQHVTRDFSET